MLSDFILVWSIEPIVSPTARLLLENSQISSPILKIFCPRGVWVCWRSHVDYEYDKMISYKWVQTSLTSQFCKIELDLIFNF